MRSTDKTSRRVFKAFGAWQDEKEERWLREMARAGWRLKSVNVMVYDFERADPADIVYRMDYQTVSKRDRSEYVELFRASGWEYVCALGNWHYFRTRAESGSNPDIFSDKESRIAKYQRLIALLVILLVPQNVWLTRVLKRGGLPPVITVFLAVLMAFWVYAIVRLVLRIRSLRRG